ncbi:unnamed protein product [Acanthoscelides obtectus]|uniref:DUF4817 domain-containing protein n=1 Tax=Acanthoscelides obtectus TaxID=200917 RepID=A0A9P0KFK9_ACAOB|nr:unnamed protein product [Acanthoscelides obtectus]CAK1667477.1 hypothetical protein AOBTE_LOCUS25861 [Acanthoscelides obtectus]
MLLAYGSANCNSNEAQRLYQQRYTDRLLPQQGTIATTYRRLRETESVNFQEPRSGRRCQYEKAGVLQIHSSHGRRRR